MADDPNSLSPRVRRAASNTEAPESVRRRYYVDDRGGPGLGYYVDAQVRVPAFRDSGRTLIAPRSDPNAIRDMAIIAKHRGWTIVMARGSAEFRREAWLAGRVVGLEVRGYRPTERDMQEFDRRLERQGPRSGERRVDASARTERRPGPDDPGVQSRLRVVDGVVRSRIVDPALRDRIMTAARARIAAWLERGAQFEPFPPKRPYLSRSERTRAR